VDESYMHTAYSKETTKQDCMISSRLNYKNAKSINVIFKITVPRDLWGCWIGKILCKYENILCDTLMVKMMLCTCQKSLNFIAQRVNLKIWNF
jgi:hypothetical protein